MNAIATLSMGSVQYGIFQYDMNIGIVWYKDGIPSFSPLSSNMIYLTKVYEYLTIPPFPQIYVSLQHVCQDGKLYDQFTVEVQRPREIKAIMLKGT